MITLFQITGSSSFAARCALECAGAEYAVVDVPPRARDDAPGFADVNPLKRVPAITEDGVRIAETGAIMLWVPERFPDAGLAPPVGTPDRADHLRWITWLANTMHPGWWPLMAPFALTPDESAWPSLEVRGRQAMSDHGAHLESWLTGHEWLAGGSPGTSDIYLYMLVGWGAYYDDLPLGGPRLADHFARVGSLPGVASARDLDDLDERLMRHHPELRGGKPM
ncbi:MAG: glutathione S-transferase family protein [Thermoleophilia bacterium]|nr:glutathione S-transferase family protein [Thermoleophilia bacterium]